MSHGRTVRKGRTSQDRIGKDWRGEGRGVNEFRNFFLRVVLMSETLHNASPRRSNRSSGRSTKGMYRRLHIARTMYIARE